ncbi:hypothetical protein M1M86_00705 [Dehalococcoidales bacterium]|nr:hypothetical protein [Dehalococcoidales bacterium]
MAKCRICNQDFLPPPILKDLPEIELPTGEKFESPFKAICPPCGFKLVSQIITPLFTLLEACRIKKIGF